MVTDVLLLVAGVLLAAFFVVAGLAFNAFMKLQAQAFRVLLNIHAELLMLRTDKEQERNWMLRVDGNLDSIARCEAEALELLRPPAYVEGPATDPAEEEGRNETIEQGVALLVKEYRMLGQELTEADARRQVEAMLAGRNPFRSS